MPAFVIPFVRPPIDAVDWDAMAGLMRIPDDRREPFIWALQNSINNEWCYATKKSADLFPAEINAAIARTGRAFIQAIRMRGAQSTPTDWAILEIVEKYLDGYVRAPKRGAPRRVDRFASFLEGLFYFSCGLGGRVSINRRTASGSVIDLMDELRPLLPPGLIPKVLPMSLIERVATDTRRRLPGMADPGMSAAIERLRAGDWRLPCQDEEVCPDCGGPLHWSFPLFRSRPQ